jgi:hypothetical protein
MNGRDGPGATRASALDRGGLPPHGILQAVFPPGPNLQIGRLSDSNQIEP